MLIATVADHAGAYLERHRHGVELVNCFLRCAGSSPHAVNRKLCVLVCTRFDGAVVNLCLDAITFGEAQATDIPPLDLQLYNNTGEGLTGVHFDRVFPDTRRRSPSAA